MITQDKINIMVPTYNRLVGLRRIVNTALNTADQPERLRFSFCVNNTDAATRECIEKDLYFPTRGGHEIIFEDTKQPNIALYFNLMYDSPKFRQPDTLVSMVGDDMEFTTQGWDTRILDAANDAGGECVVYCNDDFIAQDKLCVNLFTTMHIIQGMSVDGARIPFMCPLFHAEMIDVVWYYTGKYTGTLRYLGDVVIKHNHGSKAATWQDDTYKRLQPLRSFYSGNPANQRLAIAWATHCAANLIENGIGQWNTLDTI